MYSMEIEIVTTKKKLTKAIFNQMLELEVNEINDDIEIIGFVSNADVNQQRIIIVELQRFDYRIVHWNWRYSDNGFKLCRNKKNNCWSIKKEFKSKEDCSKYYNAVQEYKQCTEQIYL